MRLCHSVLLVMSEGRRKGCGRFATAPSLKSLIRGLVTCEYSTQPTFGVGLSLKPHVSHFDDDHNHNHDSLLEDCRSVRTGTYKRSLSPLPSPIVPVGA